MQTLIRLHFLILLYTVCSNRPVCLYVTHRAKKAHLGSYVISDLCVSKTTGGSSSSRQGCQAYYKQQCEGSSEFWNSLSDEQKQSRNQLDGTIHVSFDYAQNVLILHSPQQVGPIHFMNHRKCHLFGICAESLPKQVNYLIDEGELTGKGANETVSYLHHYFQSDNSINCKKLKLHCDNCRGQNKNNAVIQYLCLRTLPSLNPNIELSFMLPDHTRFGPDWCFGLIKIKYKHSYVS